MLYINTFREILYPTIRPNMNHLVVTILIKRNNYSSSPTLNKTP